MTLLFSLHSRPARLEIGVAKGPADLANLPERRPAALTGALRRVGLCGKLMWRRFVRSLGERLTTPVAEPPSDSRLRLDGPGENWPTMNKSRGWWRLRSASERPTGALQTAMYASEWLPPTMTPSLR